MKSVYYSNKFILCLSIIAVCLPAAFISQIGCGAVISLLKYMGIIFSIMYFIHWKMFNKRILMPIFLFFTWELISTVLAGTSLTDLLKVLYPLVTVIVCTYIYCTLDFIKTVRFLSYMFCFMAVMNIISFIQGGYATTEWNVIYFIGIRVNINGMFLASTSISLLNAYLGKRSDKVICIIQIVLNLIFIVSEWVSTSILSALLFAGVLLFSWMIHRWPARGKVFRRIGIVLLFLILIFMINPDVSRFSWLIEGFLGESLTLDGRTVLWQHALSQLGGVDWLFGRGYGNDALFEIGNGFVATTAHSQYINILFRHGFVGLAFYAIILIQQIRNATTCENTVVQAIMMASFIATIAMNIVNSTYLEGYIYIWWIVCLLYLRNDFIIGCES